MMSALDMSVKLRQALAIANSYERDQLISDVIHELDGITQEALNKVVDDGREGK